MRIHIRRIALALYVALAPLILPASLASARADSSVAVNDVTWNSLGTNENDSMPLGNGDVALNVWTEQNGDIVLLIAKADAWSENGQLLKLGRVRVRLTPNPIRPTGPFTQTLKLETGDVQLQAGENRARIWVDANHPVIHVEVQTEAPVELKAKSEVWRTKSYHLDRQGRLAENGLGFLEWGNNPDGLDFDPDTILPAQGQSVFHGAISIRAAFTRWCLNGEHLESLLPKYPDPLLHRCFGVTMKGPGLASSSTPDPEIIDRVRQSLRLDLYALTRASRYSRRLGR